MRIYLMILAALSFLVILSPTASFAELKGVRLTKDQVMTACGKNYEESNGLGGCTIACAGGKTCDFSCGGDRCSGRAERVMQQGTIRAGGGEPAFLIDASEAAKYCPKIGTAPTCGVPCDPFLCKIFCPANPDCVVIMERQPVKHEPDLTGSSLVTPVKGGNSPTAPVSPVGVVIN